MLVEVVSVCMFVYLWFSTGVRKRMSCGLWWQPSLQVSICTLRLRRQDSNTLPQTHTKSVNLKIRASSEGNMETIHTADSHPLKCSLTTSRQLDLRLTWYWSQGGVKCTVRICELVSDAACISVCSSNNSRLSDNLQEFMKTDPKLCSTGIQQDIHMKERLRFPWHKQVNSSVTEEDLMLDFHLRM